MALDQTDYRWENDDGSESASTFLAAVNTSVDIDVANGDVSKRLRIALFNTAAGTISTGQLEFSINGGAWTNLTTSSTPVKAFNSTNLTDSNDCTQRINATTFVNTNEGVIETGSGGISEFDGDGVEHLYTITFISSAMSYDDSINFRIAEASTFTNTANAIIKITPTITTASIRSVENGTSLTASLTPTLKASGNDRILVIAFVHKDNSSTAALPSAIVVDSAGVNATLANGKVVQQGSLQLAQEGNFSNVVDIYFCLETNLPATAGVYTVTTTLDSSAQYHTVQCLEVSGCPAQAYDAIVQGASTTDVSASVAFSASITPIVNDCLIVDFWATSHSSAPTFTSTESQMATTSRTNGGSVSSQFTQTTAAAKTMEETSSTFHQRRAYTLLSFNGATASNTNINVGVKALAITTNIASINKTKNISVGVQALSIVTLAASISLAVNIPVNTQSLNITTNNAVINLDKNINAGVQSLAITSYNSNINFDKNILVNTQALSITENVASISLVSNKNVNVSVQSLAITSYSSNINKSKLIDVGFQALSITENIALITTDNSINVNVGIQVLTLTSYSSNINKSKLIDVGFQALAITTYGSSIVLTTNKNINVNTQALAITENTANISKSKLIDVGSQALIITTNTASVTTDNSININVSVQALSIITKTALITTNNVINIPVNIQALTLNPFVSNINAENNVNTLLSVLTITSYSANIVILTTPTPSIRTLVIGNENRIEAIKKENRNLILTKEDRITAV